MKNQAQKLKKQAAENMHRLHIKSYNGLETNAKKSSRTLKHHNSALLKVVFYVFFSGL